MAKMADRSNAVVDDVYHMLREIKRKVVGFDIALKDCTKQIKQTNARIDQLNAPNVRPLRDIPEMRLLNEQRFIDSANTSFSSSSEDARMRSIDRNTSCMADALKRNIERIVNDIPFEILQDRIVQCGLVTTNEANQISQIPEDRTKTRIIVVNIMDKKIGTMQKFLDLIGEIDPRVKQSIQDAFDSAVEGDRSDILSCTACLLKARINIKDIADSLFSQGVISNELYKSIVYGQSSLTEFSWDCIFDALLYLPRICERDALERVLTDEEGLNNHDDLVQHVRRDFARNRRPSRCRCSFNDVCDDDGPTHTSVSSSLCQAHDGSASDSRREAGPQQAGTSTVVDSKTPKQGTSPKQPKISQVTHRQNTSENADTAKSSNDSGEATPDTSTLQLTKTSTNKDVEHADSSKSTRSAACEII